MNPEMSGSPSKQKLKRKQKRKCEIDSNDADQISSKIVCTDSLPYHVIARTGTVDLTIQKAETDKQEYCYLKLHNDLQVLVVSDSVCEIANVNLLVKCGSFNDPESVPGLAHCLEHMIYLRNMKTLSHINQFDHHLHEYSGTYDAITDEERSEHSFSVPSRYLSKSMTRFADTIVHARFDKTSIMKEVKVINTEFEYNIKDDEGTQFWAALVRDNPVHPFGRDGCGNEETLQESVDLKVLMQNLYKDHYISSNMCLVVIGKQPINMLIKMVVDSAFGHMPKTEPTTPVIRDHVIKQTKRQAFINYDYQANDRLRIQWKIDSYSWKYPVKYINTLIGHNGKKGLLENLKNRGWALEMEVGFNDICTDSTIYCVSIHLTKKGIKCYDKVVGIVYSYICFVQENEGQENLEKMCKNMAEHDFVYYQNREDYAAFLCGRLWDVCYHDFKVKYILKEYALPEEGKNMNRFLNQLVPGNCRIVVSGNDICAELDDKVKEDLKFTTKTKYHPSYDICNIDEKTIREWNEHELKSSFEVPDVRQYYPVYRKHKKTVPELKERISSKPKLIHRTKQCTVWYKQDSTTQDSRVLHPFASFRLCLTPASPDAKLDEMFVEMCKDCLQHLCYEANFGGLTVTILDKGNMLTVLVEGYPEHVKICVSSIAIVMQGMIEDMKNEVKNAERKKKRRGTAYKPFQIWYLQVLVMLLNAPPLFLVCGHISKEEALELCHKVRISFCDRKEEKVEEEEENGKEEDWEEEPRYRRVDQEFEGKRWIKAQFDCSAACDEFGVAIVDLFCHVFYWDCYSFLRSLCTLAYKFQIGEGIIIDKQKRSSYMVIDLEAKESHDSALLCIEFFLIFIIKTRFEQLSDNTFAKHKAALKMKYKRNPINQRAAHSNYWTSLLKSTSGAKDEKYFTDLATEKKNYSTALDKIELSDLKKFYEKYIHPAGDSVKFNIIGDFENLHKSVYMCDHDSENLSKEISECMFLCMDLYDNVFGLGYKKRIESEGLLEHKSLDKKP